MEVRKSWKTLSNWQKTSILNLNGSASDWGAEGKRSRKITEFLNTESSLSRRFPNSRKLKIIGEMYSEVGNYKSPDDIKYTDYTPSDCASSKCLP